MAIYGWFTNSDSREGIFANICCLSTISYFMNTIYVHKHKWTHTLKFHTKGKGHNALHSGTFACFSTRVKAASLRICQSVICVLLTVSLSLSPQTSPAN